MFISVKMPLTAKGYLKQAFWLDNMIRSDNEELLELKELAASIPGVDLTRTPVVSFGNDRTAKIVEKYIHLEGVIQAEAERLIDLKAEIRDRIGIMPDANLRLILQKRYLNLQKWEQIAMDLGFTYRNTMYIHKEALKLFSKIYKIDTDLSNSI